MGIAIGAAMGAATNNMGIWLAIGISVGLAIGVGLDAQRATDDRDTPTGNRNRNVTNDE